MNQPKTTITGTNIEEVKQLNAQSGLTYNEAKALLAKQKGFLQNNKPRNEG
ncbi:hypothetical protein [Alkalihalobacterium alkalinitrilicum]|uniref:hypothetical protein n=1 Tax=Alkalihalobacterium alkalinitrilicum TaxID=427920 RepID=UPI001302F6AE|nr:hypothetical protein [Alkalihalobacterium alkalinitrilicum]